MDAKFLVSFILFLVLVQQPSLTCEINLEKSFYQPGETIFFDITIKNQTSAKECIETAEITLSDPFKVLCTIIQTYPADTECIEPGEENVYTYSCSIPLNAVAGVGTVEADIEMWSGAKIIQKEFFEIGINYPPEITVISYPDVVNPVQEYTVVFSVYDNFGIEDLVSAEVSVYHEVTKPSERECYLFTWEKPDPYTVWKSAFPVSADASIQNSEIVWTITFSLSEIASPGEWTLDITVYDVPHQHDHVLEHVVVTKYVSFHLQDTSRGYTARINFGKAEPGEELSRISLFVVVTSNSLVNILVQGEDLYSQEGGVLPVESFSVETSSGNVVRLDGSRQAVCLMYAEKSGFNKKVKILLVFYGKLPEVIEAGTYSGVWYIIVEAV